MADWTDIDPNTLLPGEPWTSAKAIAAFENQEAIAEGAEDAPKVQGRALNVYIGELTISGATEVGFTDLDRMTVFRCDLAVINNAGTVNNFQIAFSNDNGATYGGFQTITSLASGVDFAGVVRFDLSTGIGSILGYATSGVRRFALSLTVPANANAFKVRCTGASSGEMAVYCFGGKP